MSAAELTALKAYAECRRADMTATVLRATRKTLTAAGLIRNCRRTESPMFVAVTPAGRAALAAACRPEQLELFALPRTGRAVAPARRPSAQHRFVSPRRAVEIREAS